MQAIAILVVIFSFLIIVTAIEGKFKRDKQKMEAALRMREMESGYPPGTYSSYTKKRNKKFAVDGVNAFAEKQAQKELLMKGIDELQQRLDNIETIMQSRKAYEKEQKE